MKGKKVGQKITWKEYAKTWAKYTPPARPSKLDVAVMEKHIKSFIKTNKKSPVVLILGATPEFRDLCTRQNCRTVLVDSSKYMKRAMNLLIKKKNKKESFVLSDWLLIDKKFSKNSFDLVLGDFVTNNIPYQKRTRFLNNINKLLLPGGYFISRNFVSLKKFKTLKKIMNRYLKKKKVNYTELWWDFLFHLTFDKKTRTIENNKIGELDFNVLTKKGQKIIQRYFKLFPPFKGIWSVPTRVQQDMEYKKIFSIEKVVYNKDYYFHEICPIYFLKKK